ncbi:MAG: hypothetical protein V4662_17735 [Verrucomicrobiota bacterium]
MTSTPANFPSKLLIEILKEDLQNVSWIIRHGSHAARLEAFTVDHLVVTPLEQIPPNTANSVVASFEVEGECVRHYKDANGNPDILLDRLIIEGSVAWLPVDPATTTPDGNIMVLKVDRRFKKLV